MNGDRKKVRRARTQKPVTMAAVESDRKCIDDDVIIVRWFMRGWHLGGYKYRDRYGRVVKFYSTLENGPLCTRIDCSEG